MSGSNASGIFLRLVNKMNFDLVGEKFKPLKLRNLITELNERDKEFFFCNRGAGRKKNYVVGILKNLGVTMEKTPYVSEVYVKQKWAQN